MQAPRLEQTRWLDYCVVHALAFPFLLHTTCMPSFLFTSLFVQSEEMRVGKRVLDADGKGPDGKRPSKRPDLVAMTQVRPFFFLRLDLV
jgi:hypothetical protein